ncbi:hypothetical protein CH333_00555 [candidate division WOR-3 bacterium JGI_Cruoil_03_44_89]|uniref:TIGR00374 family protein n=1 Tax=candidate division WOR-3 bacterium JGI_Cruoil_03_44_89 TaxID=1973748 RepID=A0A235BYW6_UNCW3|nr:MAG: hypothetical protein CH333_00555 [candidate division WOR-3 bacterium JGI_Cruoil_03_44_89]
MQKLDMRLVRRMLRIFLIITVASITLLLLFTVTKDTLPSLTKINPFYLLLALITILFYIWFETLWLRILVWSVSGWMSLTGAMEFILGGSFLTLVPFGVAGVPLQMYILHRENGLSIGESGSVLLMRSLLLTLILPVVLPIVYIYYSTIFQQGFVLNISRYLLVAVGLGILILVLGSLNTDRTRGFLYRFAKSKKARGIVDRVTKEIFNMKSTLRQFFVRGKWKLPLAFLVACVSRACFFFLPYPILRGIGLSPPVLQTMITQIILSYLLLFAPTPGASGIAEGGGFLLFKPLCPEHLLGIFIVLWRFFSYYLLVILGGILLARMVSVDKLGMEEAEKSLLDAD